MKTKAKYILIKEALKKDILNNHFDDMSGKMPTTRELSKQFSASYLTISKALNQLQDEGFVKMIQGRGIFALSQKDRFKRAGLLLPLSGEVFPNIFTTIEQENILVIPFTPPTESHPLTTEMQSNTFERMSNETLDSILIDGRREINFNALLKHRNKKQKLTFIIRCATDIEFKNSNSVLVDYEQGAYLAANALLKKGRRKLLFYNRKLSTQAYSKKNGLLHNKHDNEMKAGIKRALVEFNLSDLFITINDDKKDLEHHIKNGVDGIIALQDNRALDVYRIAQKLHLKIGKDIGVVGYYNLHWGDALTPKLSSISIQENKIAKIATEIINKNNRNKHIKIPPKFIERESH
jgi:DNA-binding LacI/PurR family transcriptional regulator